jgi:NTE family protein
LNPVRARRRLLGWSAAGVVASQLSACTLWPDRDHNDSQAPVHQPLAVRPHVAWVFSSGGPRGYVHVGVVQALEELGLKPDLIVGASAGALVGVLCAAGFSGRQLRQRALDLQPLSLARLSLGSAERLSTLAIADWVNDEVDLRPLEALRIPVACVSYRRDRRELVALTRGNAGLAVAASCAIEGQFAPVRIRGQLHVDADLHQPLPVRLARSLGARTVIAVDASVHLDRAPAGAERFRQSDLMKAQLIQADAVHADLVIKPDFGYWVSLTRDFRERAIESGYRETLALAPALRNLKLSP